MKRIIQSVLVIGLMILLVACGETSSVPEGMNEQTYDIGVQALEIIEKYNDGDIEADEAQSRIDTLDEKLNALDLEGDEATNNLFVSNALESFKMSLAGIGDNDTYSVEDELKSILNE